MVTTTCNIDILWEGGLLERGAYFIFSLKRGLIREGVI